MYISVKRLFIMFIVLCVTMAFAPVGVFADDYDDEYDYSYDDYEYDDESGGNSEAIDGDLDFGTYNGIDWRVTPDYELIIGSAGKTQKLTADENGDFSCNANWFDVDVYSWNDSYYSYSIVKCSFEGNVVAEGKLSNLFCGLKYMANIDFTNLDTSNVTDMSWMFHKCESLKELDLSSFDTRKVYDMSKMFYHCYALTKIDLSKINTSSVYYMDLMFADCHNLENLDLSRFDTSNVYDMEMMFSNCYSITKLDLSKFDTSKVTDMHRMFEECTSLTGLDLSNFNTSNVTDMSYMFEGCEALSNLNIKSFDTSNVTDMCFMFQSCKNLKNLDVSSFDTGKVTSMYRMFHWCEALADLDLSKFNTENVEYMNEMFSECTSLKNLDVSNFDTSKVKYMEDMFNECTSLKELDLSSFDMNNVLEDIEEVDPEEYTYDPLVKNMLKEVDLDILRTPQNVKVNVTLMNTMYDGSGKAYTSLPQNTSSILLTKDKNSSAHKEDQQSGNTDDNKEGTVDNQNNNTDTNEGGTEENKDNSTDGNKENTDDNSKEGNNAEPAVKTTVSIKSIDKFKITDKVWTGKAIKPKMTLKYKGTKLIKGTDYTIKYTNNKNVGKAKVTITGKGNYKGTLTKTFKIIPKKPTIKNPKAAKKAITVNWKAMKTKMSKKRITGYQVQIAKNNKFTKGKKSFKVKGYKETSYTFTKLKSKTKYFVRVRTYRTISGKTYYSKWSSVKNIKAK